MFNQILLAFVCLTSALNIAPTKLGEAVKCYHCYDSFNRTLSLGSDPDDAEYENEYVQCDRDMNYWNTWECPDKWPVCVIMSGKVGSIKKHYEIMRSCAVRNFCAKYKPPIHVKLESCRECNTTLCNDFPAVTPPGPRFVFNININLNVKRYPLIGADDKVDD